MSYRQNALTYDALKRIDDRIGPIHGWDFSRMRTSRDAVPWDYHEVARRYLSAGSRVLDVGTGGGEHFLRLAPYFGSGVGADPDADMLDAARENAVAAIAAGLPEGRVTFEPMPEDALPFRDDSFDVVLLRHAPVLTDEVLRVLRPGGVFVTQGVGQRNMRNICRVFGVTAYGEALPGPHPEAPAPHDATPVGESFDVGGRRATILARGEYDVRYFVRDAESLLFWLKALSHLAPGGFTVDRHWPQVAQIMRDFSTPEGIQTNEHRSLLILRKE